MSKADEQGPKKAERYWTGAHTTHKIRYHLVFVPKYRKRVLQGSVAARLEVLLRQACEVNGWDAEELAIQPDHIHLLVQVQPRFSVSQIVNTLKGGTSRVLRAEYPDLEEYLWGKSFWADGYFAATVGVVEGSAITAYIRNQQHYRLFQNAVDADEHDGEGEKGTVHFHMTLPAYQQSTAIPKPREVRRRTLAYAANVRSTL